MDDTAARGPLVGGFLKGLKVIEAFNSDRPRQSIADVSRATGQDRATCRRLLLTLVHAGYAEHDGKLFWLSPRTISLGNAYLHSATLPNLLQRHLEQLSSAIHESCSASVIEGDNVVYVARASYERVMSINLRIGSRLPVYCSSMGRVLLAAMSTEQARAILGSIKLERLTPATCVRLDELMTKLATVEAQGYAMVDEELEVGLRSVAVPVYSSKGEVVAAINIGANAARVSCEHMRDMYLPQLIEVQRRLRTVL